MGNTSRQNILLQNSGKGPVEDEQDYMKIIPRRMNYGSFCHDGNIVDSLTWVWYQAPQSYTGEDVLELFCHGNPLIVQKITRILTSLEGVRLAERGEFTCRAFEAGKMDLVQAEAVGDLIHAHTRADLANAQKLLEGSLSTDLSDIQQKIMTISAHLELEVDFAEEEADAEQDQWLQEIRGIRTHLQNMIQVYTENSRRKHVPRVAVCGTPNAGKSSLLNALLREDRLLVSSEAGTTRDYVEIPVLLEQGEIMLVDTAGLSDNPVSELDRLSMEKTISAIRKADGILVLLDGHAEYDAGEEGSPKPCVDSLDILTQKGLCLQNSIRMILNTKCDSADFQADNRAEIAVSAQTGDGLEELRSQLNALFFGAVQESEEFWLGNDRQLSRVRHAVEALNRAMEILENGSSSPEILAFEMQIVRDSMAEILGEITTDDILHHIFEGFCIGK